MSKIIRHLTGTPEKITFIRAGLALLGEQTDATEDFEILTPAPLSEIIFKINEQLKKIYCQLPEKPTVNNFRLGQAEICRTAQNGFCLSHAKPTQIGSIYCFGDELISDPFSLATSNGKHHQKVNSGKTDGGEWPAVQYAGRLFCIPDTWGAYSLKTDKVILHPARHQPYEHPHLTPERLGLTRK